MAERRRIRVSSTALGEREHVKVWVYESLDDMRRDADKFNHNDHSEALGVTHSYVDGSGRSSAVMIRLWRGALGTQVVSHEMHHAATAIYGAHVGDRISRQSHLNHYNEPFAHLYSDLLCHLVDRLYACGYYSKTDERT